MEKPVRVMGGASMYVDLLRHALANWESELSSEALLDHVVACRLALHTSAHAPDASAYLALATDVAYDSALVRMCEACALDSNVANFSFPSAERRRLEDALGAIGINLTDYSRRHQVEW
jgi:uncharacterized protein YbjT (DUF2867 family)